MNLGRRKAVLMTAAKKFPMAKIAFLQLNEYELHGTQSIAAVLRAHGHSCQLVVPGFERDPMAAILRAGPDVVGIGFTTVERQEALLWARALKKRTRALVILGGIDPTFHPRLALEPGVDGLIRGEAEYSMLELVDRSARGEDLESVPGLAVNRGGELIMNPAGALVEDLDTLPFPDKDLYFGRYRYYRDFPIKGFMAGRGCPGSTTIRAITSASSRPPIFWPRSSPCSISIRPGSWAFPTTCSP